MTDRNQSGVDWEDDEFLFAVDGLDEEEGGNARPVAGERPGAARPPEAGLTAFFGSKRGAEAEPPGDPLEREEASLSGLMGESEALGADDLMQELSVRPEEQLRGHFGEPAHPLAQDEAWEGAAEEQPLGIGQSFHAAADSFEMADAADGTDGWGFDGGTAAPEAASAEEETFAFVDEAAPPPARKPDHGFQLGADRHSFPPAERLRTEPLAAIVNPVAKRDDLLDDDFAGDDSEVVSWSDSGEELDELQSGFDEEVADESEAAPTEAFAASEEESSYEGQTFGSEDESLEGALTGELVTSESASAPRRDRGPRTRRFLLVGSGLLAAALAALAVPYVLEMVGGENPAVTTSPAAARTAKANPPKAKDKPAAKDSAKDPVVATGPGAAAGAATGGTAAADPGATTGEVARAEVPDPVPPLRSGEQTTNPTAPTTVESGGEVVASAPPAAEAPREELPTIENRPDGSIGNVDIGGELALSEALPESQGSIGESETSESFTPGEDRPIPATAWADMGGAVPAGDTLLRQSKVRVQLRNGAEFDGQLRKIDDTMIELKVEQGTVVFVFDDLREILPLEAPTSRLSEYPEGFVEFRSQARIWGRIISDLPTHVTLSFGPANLSIPKRAVKLVQEQPMSTILLGASKAKS
ncbi:MAG: hypothetical protein IPN34_06120 [Planctomycetes bacterium]|nr:hypothetical protein [Planctomycetota bacterium]